MPQRVMLGGRWMICWMHCLDLRICPLASPLKRWKTGLTRLKVTHRVKISVKKKRKWLLTFTQPRCMKVVSSHKRKGNGIVKLTSTENREIPH
jgi:hypothetical protein